MKVERVYYETRYNTIFAVETKDGGQGRLTYMIFQPPLTFDRFVRHIESIGGEYVEFADWEKATQDDAFMGLPERRRIGVWQREE